MEQERVYRDDLIEKRPPLYIYRAKLGEKTIFLHEIIPFITTRREAIKEFLEKAESFSKIKSPDISQIINVKKKGIRIIVFEEFNEGTTFKSIIRTNRTFDPLDAIHLIYSIAKSFQKFHSKGFYGLGIEPKNIIVHETKNITIVHPIISIAEKFFRKTDKPEMLNPRYLSPEQIRKNVSNVRSDLFTIGIHLFEILNNIYPFSTGTYQLLDFRKHIPNSLKLLNEKLLQFDPAKRFDSFRTFFEELHICRDEIQSERTKEEEEERKEEEEIRKIKEPIKEKKEEKRKEIKEPIKEKKEEKVEKKVHIEKRKEKKEKLKEEKITPRKERKEIKKEKVREKKEIVKKTKRERVEKRPKKKRTRPKKKLIIPKKPVLIGVTALIFIVCLFVFIPKIIRMIKPYNIENFFVERNVIEAKDKQGKVLWRFKTGSDITFSNALDIDNDTRKELLVGTGFMETDANGWKKRGKDNGKIYIINENGKPTFIRDIGIKSIYPDGSSLWIIYDIQTIDIDNDTHNDIVVFAITEDSLDCILYAKTYKGITSSFWHSGMITTILPSYLPGEEPKLLCGGVNSRTGDKPVVFALEVDSYNDQSPPWGGKLNNVVDGLLWYRFLPGGGPVSNIGEEDSLRFVVVTEKGLKKMLLWNGNEFSKEDTTEEMVKERGELYFQTFDSFKKAMELQREKSIASALVSLNSIINKVSEDNSFNSALLYLKGMMHFTERRWKSSTTAFNNATKLDPLFYGAFSMLGEVYSEREQFSNAISSFNKAYTQSKKEKYFYKSIDSYIAQGNFIKARSKLLSFEKSAKNKILFLRWSAHTARENGDFTTAASLYEKMILLDPKTLKSYILLADIYADMNKNIEKADSFFTFVSKKDTALQSENIETEAWILYRKSQFENAFRKINVAIDREEERTEVSVAARRKLPRLYYRKAIISQPIGKKEEKEAAIKKARSSRFCKGYIKRQLDYLIGSP